MANYHILETDEGKRYVQVVFHIAVPSENNSAGVNLQTCIAQYVAERDAVTSVPWLETDNPTEYAALAAGAVYEHGPVSVEIPAYGTVLEQRDAVDARYTQFAVWMPEIIRKRFLFWGLDRDV